MSDLERHELCDAFIASARALGIPANDDFNGPAQEGTGYYRATTTYRGRRRSTAAAYLGRRGSDRACGSRSTLSRRKCFSTASAPSASSTGSAESEKGRAPGSHSVGRDLQLAPAPRAFRRRRAAKLEEHGIPVVHDLPRSASCRTTSTCARSGAAASHHAERRHGEPVAPGGHRPQYLLFREGPLTISAGHAAAFVRTRPEPKRPDAQIYFINFSAGGAAASCMRTPDLRAQCRSCRWSRAARAYPLGGSARRRRSATTTSQPRTTGA